MSCSSSPQIPFGFFFFVFDASLSFTNVSSLAVGLLIFYVLIAFVQHTTRYSRDLPRRIIKGRRNVKRFVEVIYWGTREIIFSFISFRGFTMGSDHPCKYLDHCWVRKFTALLNHSMFCSVCFEAKCVFVF